MMPTPVKRWFLLGMPLLLIPSTALAFTVFAQCFGDDWGYLLGFVVYWIWCLGVPLICFGGQGFLAMSRVEIPLFRENWLPAILWALTIVGAFAMYFVPNAAGVSVWILVFAPIAIVNGVCQEVLWRGTYVKAFRHAAWLACVYPALWFAISHVSPGLVFPAEGGGLPFVISTFFLGLTYGWIAYRTGSVKWTAIAPSLTGLLAFGEPLSGSIARIVLR